MSPPIVTDGPMMVPDRGIHELAAGFGASIGATAAESWSDSPLSQLMTGGEIARAKGVDGTEPTSFDPLGNATVPSVNGVDLTEEVKPAVPRMDIIEANDRVKKAGLDKHLTLPDQPDIPPAQLAIMMRNAQARAEREATIERGPQGFIPSALQVGTSFLVGAADPINVASAFIPIMGELRYGKVLAAAGDSLTARLAARAAVGAAQGAVGQAALEPLDWWAHTQEGRDFGMSDVLHNIMFGAALGGGLHAGGGFISDAYRNAKGRALYPFGPGEPLALQGGGEAATGAMPPSPAHSQPEMITSAVVRLDDGRVFEAATHAEAMIAAEDAVGTEAANRLTSVDDKGLAGDFRTSSGRIVGRQEAAELARRSEQARPDDVLGLRAEDIIRKQEEDRFYAQLDALPSPAVNIINDLPPRAHEDAMRVAISDLINGDAVRSGDVLEAASRSDPRIAESLDIPKTGLRLVRDDHLPSKGDTVSYSINGADGSNVGFAEFVIDGDTARVLDVASFAFNGDRERYGEVRNSIGARQMRELLDQFRELHPEVKKLTADRVSGARKGGEYDAGLKGNEIEVKLPQRGSRGRAAADPQTWSLFEFLAHEGGIKPDPELAAIFGNAKGPFVPGFGALVRPKGRALDDALRLAKDHGYMFDAADVTGAEGRLTPNDLLDRLAEENSGRKLYRHDQQFATKAQVAADLEREKHEIISALHDEIEAATGQKGVKIDPALQERVVQIVQREGEHDVLGAYERAIMEDAERYEGLSSERRQQPETAHIPGWDADEPAGASADGRAAASERGQAGLPGEGQGRADGGQPRRVGAGDRGAVPAQLDQAAAWRGIAHVTPDFDTPEAIAASKAAAEVQPPKTKLDERVTAAEKADAFAKQMYDMFAHRLPEDERLRLEERIAELERAKADTDTVSQRGAACLFEGRGA